MVMLHWEENDQAHSALWRSENGSPPPQRVVIADDTTTADVAYRLACAGTAMLWRGDFHNARQLLQAMGRRFEHKPKRKQAAASTAVNITEAFHLHRQSQLQRARILGMLLLPVDAGHVIPARRAPDMVAACSEAYGEAAENYVVSLRELQGLNGAHEWRKKGVQLAALGAAIHPHYGVFSPLRGEYVQLVADAKLPDTKLAFDIGTGTGVLAAVLAQRGVQRVIATEQNPRALACAADNIARLGLVQQIELLDVDLFPPGQAALIVCNPPWLPARANSLLDQAVYDPDSRMLLGFLQGLAAHLAPKGEGWLILSDLAEHLGLRTREFLLTAIAQAGLVVLGRSDVRPSHGKAADASDPLHAARTKEVTSLWRLGKGLAKGD